MARSVSTIPKTSSKPVSGANSAVPVADAVVDKPAKKAIKKEKVVAPVVEEVVVPEVVAKKAKAPKKAKVVTSSDPVEAVASEAPVDSSAEVVVASSGESANKLNASISEVVQAIRDIELQAKLLRAKCKSLMFASKKECQSSRKFNKAKKEATTLAEGEVYKTACQKLTDSAAELSKSMSSEMALIKSRIGKFSALHSEQVKLVRKQKKETRKRAPPAASVQPVQVDPKISAFMGTAEGVRLSRHDVFTAIRAHISANQCYVQGHGKKFIQPDAALAPLFANVPEENSLQITHFNMQKYLKDYFIKDPVVA